MRGLRPKLVYAIPDHQNPAGVSLSAERRSLLVELARRHGFLIVEDVAYRELGFAAQAPASLWSLAPDVVVQAGTTSKRSEEHTSELPSPCNLVCRLLLS